jgi:transcriptional regulator with XRE-family HTH domain
MSAKRTKLPGKPTLHGGEKDRVRKGADRVCQNFFAGNMTEMAAAFEVSQATVSRWMSGQSSPSWDCRERIAEFLEISDTELRTGMADRVAAVRAKTQLDRALAYDAGRWSPQVIAQARMLSEKRTPQQWAERLDELTIIAMTRRRTRE